MEWLLGSLSAGASAAHAFTKGSGFCKVPMFAHGGGGPVSEPSAVMRAKATNRSGFWSSPVFPDQLRGVIGSAREVYLSSGSTLDPIDPAAVKATAHAYGTRKSNGSDHWGARELATLPLAIVGHFTDIHVYIHATHICIHIYVYIYI